MQYTPAQQAAVDFPAQNLLLSAAAGSGKTATLTGRILALLETEDVRLTEMLIVTYTRAAASELRGRIGQKITEAARKSARGQMARHLADLPGADISTIHAFLYRTLRPSFPALGLSPDFTIGDEAVIDSLQQEAMRDTLDDFYSGKAEEITEDMPETDDFIRLADALSTSRDTETLDKTLLSIYNTLTSAGETPASLAQYAAMLDDGADSGFFTMPQSQPIRDRLMEAADHYTRLLEMLRREFTPVVTEKYGPAADELSQWLATFTAALHNPGCGYDTIRTILATYTPQRLKALSAKDATDASDGFKVLRENLKKDVIRFHDRFLGDSEEILTDSIRRTADLLRTCGKVLTLFAARFRQKKMNRSLLDYGDLESLATTLFLSPDGTPTKAAVETGRRYKYIFIDEYQDTNRVQDAIFRALSAEAVRFMVGDSKQSIYRFRGAEPSVFAGYRDAWPTVSPDDTIPATALSPQKGFCLFMRENFRCDRPVVDFVNLVSDFLFPHSHMPYAEEDKLVFGKNAGDETPVQIVLLEKDTPDEDDKEDSASSARTEEDPEAGYVADKVAAMLTEHTLVESKPVTPDDIAILLRSPDKDAAMFARALTRRGIPVRLQNTAYLFTSPAILLVLCLTYCAANPLLDIPVAGAMHSPLFGFATHELVQLRTWSRAVLQSGYRWSGDMPLYYIVRIAVEENWDFLPDPPDGDSPDPSLPALSDQPDDLPDTGWMNNPWAEQTDMTAESAEDCPVSVVLPEEIREKCRVFHSAMESLRTLSHGLPADRFLDMLYRRFGLFDLPEIAENPLERTNLLSLYDIARRYESGTFGGIGGFLTYTEELRRKEREKSTEDNVPAVTILSIHKSKGLEFPVVFVSACAKKRNTRDEEGDILFDPDLGFGMRLPDQGGYTRCGSALRSAIAEKKRRESVEEEMRVLYVALTRARNRLIITGKVKNAEASLGIGQTASFPYTITGNATYLDWILAAALTHGPDPCWSLATVEKVTDADPEPTTLCPPPPTDTGDKKRSAEEWEEIFRQNTRFLYPYAHLTALPSKLSVSDLKNALLDEALFSLPDQGGQPSGSKIPPDESSPAPAAEPAAEPAAFVPRFMTETEEVLHMSAAERGTATHLFLQFANFHRLRQTGAEAEAARLVEMQYLSPKTAEAVYLRQLEKFRNSDLLRRICAAKEVWREFRFNIPMDACRFTADPVLAKKLREENVSLIVQGVVDCVFREEDGTLTLVDYKTDHPLAEEYKNPSLADSRFLQRHITQIRYYREICERIFEEKIHRTILYSTALGREIPVL